jgi:hypothetical protein
MNVQQSWIELCRSLGAVVGTVKGSMGTDEPSSDWERRDFLSSYETSYSMTLAYPDDLLIESARAVGIAVEGREKIDIVRDMVALQRERDEKHDGT